MLAVCHAGVDQRLGVCDERLRLSGVLRLLLVIVPIELDAQLVLLGGEKFFLFDFF
jgi:hypothetical protein